MLSNVVLAAVLAHLVAAAPAPVPQEFDFDAILQAPTPDAIAPPIEAVATTSVYTVDTASLAASISASVVTDLATASITGSAASAASTLDPTTTDQVAKRGYPASTTSSKPATSSSSSSSAAPPSTTSPTSTTVLTTSTTTTSSDTSCPTQPEAGTYCGFINPEDECAPQPDGYGPKVVPDTVDAFLAYPPFHQSAQSAITPSGYAQVFKDLNASTSANSYITFQTLTSYNVSGCAAICDQTALCTAFNIYIERDPSLNPTSDSAANGTYCPNPSSITNYKCSLWGSNIDASSATNTGGYRDEFQVVITGSNGYDKTNTTIPATPPGWSQPSKCNGGAINSGGSYWVGSSFFPGPFNPAICGIYAQAQTAKNKAIGKQMGAKSYVPCNQFNAYMVELNHIPQGTYCAIFNTVLDNSWASFLGAKMGGSFFGVKNSWTYNLKTLDSGRY